jgi:hypothetical protein
MDGRWDHTPSVITGQYRRKVKNVSKDYKYCSYYFFLYSGLFIRRYYTDFRELIKSTFELRFLVLNDDDEAKEEDDNNNNNNNNNKYKN